jgi:hypothetical protein
MIDLLSSLPLWLLGFVLNVWLVGTAVAGLYVARRWVVPALKLRYEDAYVGAVVVQSAMVLYGLVAALTMVGVWQKHTQVGDIVSAEATAVANLWRDLGGYPEPLRDTSRDLLREYTEQIIFKAWPMQRRGQVPTEGVEWMNRLQAQLFPFNPANEGQKIAHAEVLRAFNTLVHHRRQRLDSVQTGLPGVLWFVLLSGAMGCVTLSLLFKVDNAVYQGVMVGGLASFLAMLLFVTFALDRPFQGDMAVGPESYQLIYDHHMKK